MNPAKQMNPASASPELSYAKKFCFGVVLVVFMAIASLVALELLVRVSGLRTTDDPYLEFGRVGSFFSDLKIDGIPHKQVDAGDLYDNREVTFAKQKPEKTFRILSGEFSKRGLAAPG